jgi:hypothetical protein
MRVAASQKKPARRPFLELRRGLGRRGRIRLVSAAAAVLTFAAGSAVAQPSIQEQQEFAKAYVAALRSQDVSRLEATIHPATLACINPANRAYFDAIFKSQLEIGLRLGPAFSIKQLAPVTEGRVTMLPPEGFAYPVQPSYRIQINADRPDRSVAVQAFLAPGPGGWFAVHPCPNAAGMKYFAELSPRRNVDGAVIDRLDANMPPRLRDEVGALLGQGRFIDAVHYYMAASGADASTASMVVEVQRLRRAPVEGH